MDPNHPVSGLSANILQLWVICNFKILNKLKIVKNGVNVKKKRLDFGGVKCYILYVHVQLN